MRRIIIRILCKILKFIEELIMKLIPNICGKDAVTLPSICGEIGYFKGIENATINQGETFDVLQGVTAYNSNGEQVPFDVTPSEVVPCQVGAQVFTYTSEDATATRTITVNAIGDPTINGISESISVGKGVEFDPLEGVSATDGNGNPLTVTVTLVQGA